jgi:hypothetical protein
MAVIVACISSANAAQCNMTPESLSGDWEAVGTRAFFELMSFQAVDGTQRFDSWRHVVMAMPAPCGTTTFCQG